MGGDVNVVTFTELTRNCWTAGGATAEAAKAGLLWIGWQVVTNATTSVPFDFCVSNVLALN